MMPIEDLRALVVQSFPDAEVHLNSPMGDNNHFQLMVVSDQFQEMTMVEQHQMVYKAIGNAMDEAVHALSIKTLTPAQWEKAGGAG